MSRVQNNLTADLNSPTTEVNSDRCTPSLSGLVVISNSFVFFSEAKQTNPRTATPIRPEKTTCLDFSAMCVSP